MHPEIHTSSRADRLLTVARAILIGVLLNLRAFVAHFWSGGTSIHAFNDWDEPLYLKFTTDYGRYLFTGGPPPAYDISTIIVPNFGHTTPDHLSDAVVGGVAHLAGVAPITLGLLLDFVLFPICFLIARAAFKSLGVSSWKAEAGALAFLAFPQLASPRTFLVLPFSIGPFVWHPLHDYTCLPIVRATHTQVSYLMVSAALYFLGRAITTGSGKEASKAGACVGLSIYAYLFAWVSMSTWSVVLVCLLAARKGREMFRSTEFKLLIPFLLSNLLVAMPGLALFFVQGTGSTFELGPARSGYFPFSPEMILFTVGALLVFFAFPIGEGIARRAAAMVGAAYLSVLGLIYLQPITGHLVTPYHFWSMFLFPIASGALTVGIFTLIHDERLVRWAVAACTVVVAGVAAARLGSLPRDFREEAEQAELIDHLAGKNEVLAVKPFFGRGEPGRCTNILTMHRLLPYWIRALDTVRVGPASRSGSPEEDRRELLLGWLYSGALSPTYDCTAPPELPGDIVLGVLTFTDIDWYGALPRWRALAARETPCSLVQSFDLDLVLYERGTAPLPPQLEPFMREEWSSSAGSFTLYEFDRDAFVSSCAGAARS